MTTAREQLAREAFIAHGLNGRSQPTPGLDYARMWDDNPHATWRTRWLYVADAIHDLYTLEGSSHAAEE